MGLANKAVADTTPKMGRPPLGVRPLTVRLPAEQIARIEVLRGPNQAAAFIREAVDEKLKRDERK